MAQRWGGRRPRSAGGTAPADSPMPAYTNPQMDLEAFGPVMRHNHVAYVPVRELARVPGVGTGNLVYTPDFLLTPPASIAGNGQLRQATGLLARPVMIARPKTVLEGVGGLVAGQIVHQPLLEIDVQNNDAALGGDE